MVVMLLDVVPPALRGELSRWLMPVDSTVFVGRVSAEVRALLWDAAVAKAGDGRVVQIWRTQGEQGFAMRTHNLRDRQVVSVDGLHFMAVRDAAWAEAAERFKLIPPA
ncbi:MAG: type I-E CRISPR-associated endoribonuclease Cas2e [Pseudomonadota bacterium]|jgi:CRISPR-associated protein Cas2|nr:type I-E CRISPR-associated endoribonuclease Cas2 [Rubrivivax sp.]MCA3259079.1 type I-E CRISPR-associated endoribonuclease Cas2 [Rubrivivax sp.]MCZ8031236.1 type I-E CRISPR-associated endoribonuclease Cas2e [Rubrivivax sp.]